MDVAKMSEIIEKYWRIILNNEDFHRLSEKNFETHFEWEITVIFYIMLHIINIILKNFEEKTNISRHKSSRLTHRERKAIMYKLVLKGLLPSTVYNAYDFIYLLSLDARYDLITKDQIEDFKEIKQRLKIILDYFKDNMDILRYDISDREKEILSRFYERAFNSFV